MIFFFYFPNIYVYKPCHIIYYFQEIFPTDSTFNKNKILKLYFFQYNSYLHGAKRTNSPFLLLAPRKVLLTKKLPKIGNRCYYFHSIAFKSNLGSQFQNRMVTHKTFTQSNEITLEMTYNNPKHNTYELN